MVFDEASSWWALEEVELPDSKGLRSITRKAGMPRQDEDQQQHKETYSLLKNLLRQEPMDDM